MFMGISNSTLYRPEIRSDPRVDKSIENTTLSKSKYCQIVVPLITQFYSMI
jgi:hypothetical protein